MSLNDLENKSLEEELNTLSANDEKLIQINFKNQILLELNKVAFFFNENLKYYKARIKKIKVTKFYFKFFRKFSNPIFRKIFPIKKLS